MTAVEDKRKWQVVCTITGNENEKRFQPSYFFSVPAVFNLSVVLTSLIFISFSLPPFLASSPLLFSAVLSLASHVFVNCCLHIFPSLPTPFISLFCLSLFSQPSPITTLSLSLFLPFSSSFLNPIFYLYLFTLVTSF